MFSSENATKTMDKAVHMLPGMSAMGVLRYTMMPEILPRIRKLGMHFGHFAYLLALVFSSARLIPATHPVLNAANIGRFGVRQVIAMAANNITWSRKNIDQIGIFTAIVLGLIMIVIQAVLIAIAALIGDNPASAQSFFENPNPQNDPIMIMFANVFGNLDDFWGAGVAGNAPSSGNIIHQAVYGMLSLYSTAMMVIAVIIVLYYIMTVVGEAAKTGTPFGQRFNSLWAPIRLVVALGLLVPLGSGLNSAQYLTLWVAKAGSGLGTQVWNVALTEINPSGAERYLLNDFNNSWVRELSVHVLLMEICAQGHNKYNDISSQPADENFIRSIAEDTSTAQRGTPDRRNFRQATYGYEVRYENQKRNWIGGGGSYCGNISIKMSDEDVESSLTSGANAVPTEAIFEASKNAIEAIVASADIKSLANSYVSETISIGGRVDTLPNDGLEQIFSDLMAVADGIETDLKTSFDSVTDTDMAGKIQDFIDTRADSWAFAGTYYLEISRIAQAGQNARINAIPNTAIITTEDATLGQERTGRNAGPGGRRYQIAGVDQDVSDSVYNVLKFYKENTDDYLSTNEIPEACEGINEDSSVMSQTACTIFAMLVPENLVLLAKDETRTVDPMAALIGAGYEIVNRSWALLLASLAASTAGGILGAFGVVGGIIGGFLSAIGTIMSLIATLGLAAGVILYFMLPVFPFMYFFFAIVSWVMEIFEAVIAMPLWALAFLRIDGEGMPGQAAMSGIYLLLAILLRPALIVIGMIAGVLIFSGITFLLQNLWNDVLFVKGAGNMSGLEVLIYTLVFAYFCYSAALTSFKLVDTIPNQILRWIGSNPGTFSDNKEDPMSGSSGVLTAGAVFAGSATSQIGGAVSGMGQSAGRGLAQATGFQTRAEKTAETAGMRQSVLSARSQGATRDQVESTFGAEAARFYDTL